MGFFGKLFLREKKEKLDTGLQKTKEGVWSKLKHAIAGKDKIDDDVLDNLEEVFITSDVGVETTLKIIERIEARVKRDKYVGSAELNKLLCEEITELLAENNLDCNLDDFEVPKSDDPYVIMVVGVNGVGKTTTCGMIIDYLCSKGKGPVLVVDADANANLNEVLGVEVETSLGAIREEMANAELKGTIPAGMTKADYAELKFKTASTGLIFSSSSMAQKFGGAFGASAVMWILAAFGFNAQEGAVQTEEAVHGIRLLMSWIPAGIAVISLVFVVVRFGVLHKLLSVMLKT